MAKQKNTGKAEQGGVEQALKAINAQILRLIEVLERIESRLNGGF